MPSPVPTPLAAAFGLVPTVLSGVRRLPGKAVHLPILALSTALTSVDAARREYDDLAHRGERLIAKLRGTSFDELEDGVEDRLQGTPLATPYDVVEDALEDLTERVGATFTRGTRAAGERLDDAADAVEDASGAVRGQAEDAAATLTDAPAAAPAKAAAKAARAVAGKADQAAGAVEEKTGTAGGKAGAKAEKKAAKAAKRAAAAGTDAAPADVPAAEQPKNEPTPHATQPDSTRIDTAVSAEVERTVETVAASAGGGAVLAHDELPLADYDHMTLGSLRGRMRSLTVEQLVQVRDYEKAHADRLPIVTMLDNRIAKLASDASAAAPSGVPSDRPAAGQGDTPGGSLVTPATGGPALNPPSQGVPTNPGQPRTTGSPGTNPNSNA